MLTKFNDVLELIRNARYNALKTVNKQLIDLYWNVGEYVSKRVENEGWGKGTVAELSNFIESQEPDIKGFSQQNIWRMKQFFETYNDYPNLSPLVREISWTNNLLILSKSTSIEEKEFYLQYLFKTIRMYLINKKYYLNNLYNFVLTHLASLSTMLKSPGFFIYCL